MELENLRSESGKVVYDTTTITTNIINSNDINEMINNAKNNISILEQNIKKYEELLPKIIELEVQTEKELTIKTKKDERN